VELERIRDLLDRRRAWAESIGARYLFVVTPDKSTVYPELLPASINRLEGISETDQIVNHLNAHTKIDIVDLRRTLIDAKKHGPLYISRDTHWNDHGAYFGYRAVAERLESYFPQIKAIPLHDMKRIEIQFPGDLTKMLDLEEQLKEKRIVLRPLNPVSEFVPFPLKCPPVPTWHAPPLATRGSDSSLPKALVYHDSFMYVMAPFLAEHFAQAIYIRDQHVNLETLKDYHPDIVIDECLERMLRYFIDVDDDLRPHQPADVIATRDQTTGHTRK
jgi:hypothetical protein